MDDVAEDVEELIADEADDTAELLDIAELLAASAELFAAAADELHAAALLLCSPRHFCWRLRSISLISRIVKRIIFTCALVSAFIIFISCFTTGLPDMMPRMELRAFLNAPWSQRILAIPRRSEHLVPPPVGGVNDQAGLE